MPNLLDTFTGPDGALGPADTGQVPMVLRGAAQRRNGRGYAADFTPGTVVAYDCGIGSEDGEAECTIGTAAGYALFFRIVDVGNWWRLSKTVRSEQVQTGTVLVQTGTKTVIVGYTTVEYRWRYSYAGGSYSFLHGHTSYSAWSTSSANPGAPSSYSHSHDGVTHTMTLTDSAQEKRGGDPIYGTEPVYEEQAVYETVYHHEVRLHVSVSGSVALMRVLTGMQNCALLRATYRDDELTVRGINSTGTVLGKESLTDARHAGARRHGWGYSEHTEQSNSDGIDNMRVTVSGRARGLAMIV